MNIGRFEVKDTLGHGGMGSVLRAYDPNLGRFVAIKTLTFKGDESQLVLMKERFKREARNAAQLSHPNIVVIHDFTADQEPAYIVMELIEGRNLRQLLKQNRTLPLKDKLFILHETALALDYAHSRNVIHRDVKPENIMIRDDGAVKLTDFGIAKSLEQTFATHTLTEAGMLPGTPDYIPPEALGGEFWGARGDQYSLAVVAYETLLGRKPFSAPSLYALFYAIKTTDPPAVRTFSKHFPEPAYNVIIKALSKNAPERYASCTALIDALTAALASYQDAEFVLRDIQDEMSVWNKVHNTRDATAYREFLQRYPDSQYKSEALKRLADLELEEASWQSVQEQNSLTTLRHFLESFPEGAYASTAQRLLAAMEREASAWEQARQAGGTAIEAFLKEFPNSRYETAARELLDELVEEDAAWNAARQQQTARALRLFVSEYPRSRHAHEAEQLAREIAEENNAWLKVRESNSVVEIRDFLLAYPNGAHATQARARGDLLWREHKAWQAAVAKRTEAAVDDFLAAYPTGANRNEALALLSRLRAEHTAWEMVKDSRDTGRLSSFLEQYPDHAHSGDARALLKSVQAETSLWSQQGEAPNREFLTGYLELYPDGIHAGEATEMLRRIEGEWQAWQKLNQHDAPSLERFLRDFPHGQFTEMARANLALERAWLAIASDDVAALEKFVAANPQSPHVAEARQRLEAAKKRKQQAVEQERERRAEAQRAEAAWESLQKAPSLPAATQFLQTFAGSARAADVQALRDKLEHVDREQARKDDQLWEQTAQGDEQALQRYLSAYPSGRHAVEARRELDGIAAETAEWSRIRDAADEAPLVSFLQRHPKGARAAEAHQRLTWLRAAQGEWSRLQSSWDAPAVQGFAQRYAGSAMAAHAQQRLQQIEMVAREWAACEAQRNPDQLRAFVKQYASSPFAERARQMATTLEEEERQWKAIARDDVRALEAFRGRYPAGRFREEADKAIRAAETKAKEDAAWADYNLNRDTAACRRYLQVYADTPRAAQVKQRLEQLESEAWSRVDMANRQSVLAFLSEYPNGVHAAGAQDLVRAADRKKTSRFAAIAAAVVVVAGASFIGYKVISSGGEEKKKDETDKQAQAEKNERDSKAKAEAERAGALQQDERDWQAVQLKRTADAWNQYLKKYPQGIHAEEARKLLQTWQQAEQRWKELAASTNVADLKDCADKFATTPFGGECRTKLNQLQGEEKAWAAARSGTDEALLESFIKAFPNSPHTAEARDKLNTIRDKQKAGFDRVMAANDPSVIIIYIRENPNHPNRPRLEQRLRQVQLGRDEATARASNSDTEIDSFLKKYPEYTGDLRGKLADLRAEREWQQAVASNSEEALRRYAATYPDKHRTEIADLLRKLGAKRAWPGERDSKDIGKITAFIRMYEGTPEAREAERMLNDMRLDGDWNSARNANTEESLQRFLNEHPNSRYQRDAQDRLTALRASKKKEEPKEVKKEEKPVTSGAPKDGLEYVSIPAGTVLFGCVAGDRSCGKNEANPPQSVQLSSFRIGRTEVTVEAYKKFVEATGGKLPATVSFSKKWEEPTIPIHNLKAVEAVAYCKWMGGRLPTEAEWEYAARGGVADNIYPWGKEFDKDAVNASLNPRNRVFEAAGRRPNKFNLLHMAGNVSEFATEGNIPNGTSYVLKGGHFGSDKDQLRISFRYPIGPRQELMANGFRCVW
ncbi:MAG: SUMF1/EgtB/PvdO family nonheme iron enzyme [Acidobacteria bacterium]|nr:SUMF1/EgtB/PvdO family nonheme iron enzyme [Acidobacteriota bacterium]